MLSSKVKCALKNIQGVPFCDSDFGLQHKPKLVINSASKQKKTKQEEKKEQQHSNRYVIASICGTGVFSSCNSLNCVFLRTVSRKCRKADT